MGPQGKRPPDTRSAADGILAGCQQRADASKASLFPYPTKDKLAKALAPMLGAGSGERLTGGRPLCPDRPPATGCQPSGLDCEYAIRTQPCRMNLKSLMQPCPVGAGGEDRGRGHYKHVAPTELAQPGRCMRAACCAGTGRRSCWRADFARKPL